MADKIQGTAVTVPTSMVKFLSNQQQKYMYGLALTYMTSGTRRLGRGISSAMCVHAPAAAKAYSPIPMLIIQAGPAPQPLVLR